MAEKYINKDGLLYSVETKEVIAIDEDVKTSIQEIKLPPEQKELPKYLFSGCEALTKVTMPDVLNGFPEGLFQGCCSITDIPFRAGIEEIKPNTFEGCASLKSIVFPDSINAIRSRACADCEELETVVLPARMYALADDAFDGCTKIHNVRISEANKLFYINEKDGCLYERNVEGDDILKIHVYKVENDTVGFYKENVDNEDESFFTNEDVDEVDETFPSEVSLEENVGEENMENDNVNDMLADIMGEEKERTEVVHDIGVSDKETEVLTEMMDVMSEASINKVSSFTTDDLVNLCPEPELPTKNSNENPEELDQKTKVLVESSKNSKIIICEPEGTPPDNFDLLVVSERDDFSQKLITCVKRIAKIQDFKRIILLSGLPIDNSEFSQFYEQYVDMKHVVVACFAEGTSNLSDYCKTVCQKSRINLSKEAITEQRTRIGVKNNNIIKLIVRDVD